jgi:hypothetical protein
MSSGVHVDKAKMDASIRESVAILKDIDPVLQRQATKDLKRAADAIVQDARTRIPDVPTGVRRGKAKWGKWSGTRDWDAAKARSGVKIQFRNTRKNSDTQRPLLSITQANPAGAIWDIAGRSGAFTKGKQGAAFNKVLNPGRPSRGVWPAAESKMSEVDQSLEEALRNMESLINDRLGATGSLLARM